VVTFAANGDGRLSDLLPRVALPFLCEVPFQCPMGHSCLPGNVSVSRLKGFVTCVDLGGFRAGIRATAELFCASLCTTPLLQRVARTTPAALQILCPPGQFSPLGSNVCSNCTAGHYCFGRVPNGTAAVCGLGTFAPAGSARCTPCAAGQYGATPALPSSACTGVCPVGTYSLDGSARCEACPGGRFGNVTGEGRPLCAGNCSAGHWCPPQSSSPAVFECLVRDSQADSQALPWGGGALWGSVRGAV
jgi:hypothetical protein